MLRPQASLIGLLCVSLALCGCLHPHRVDTWALERLDYFEAGDETTLTNVDGEKIIFTEKTPLTLVMKDGRSIEETYKSIRSDGRVFEGTTTDGEVVEVAMNDVTEAFVHSRVLKPPKTARERLIAEENWFKSPTMIVLGGLLLVGIFVGVLLLFDYLLSKEAS